MRRSTSCFFLALLLCVGWLFVAHVHLEASAAPLSPLFAPSASSPSATVQTGPWANTPFYLDPEYERDHPWGAFFSRLAMTFEEVGRRSAGSPTAGMASPSVPVPSRK